MTEPEQQADPEVTRVMAGTSPPSDRSIKEIVDTLRPQLQELVSKQVEMAKAEMAPVGKKAGGAIGMLVVGAVFLLLFLAYMFLTVMYLLNEVAGLSLWLSALIVTVVQLIIGSALAGAGAGALRTLDPQPRRTIEAAKQNIEWLKGQLKR